MRPPEFASRSFLKVCRMRDHGVLSGARVPNFRLKVSAPASAGATRTRRAKGSVFVIISVSLFGPAPGPSPLLSVGSQARSVEDLGLLCQELLCVLAVQHVVE